MNNIGVNLSGNIQKIMPQKLNNNFSNLFRNITNDSFVKNSSKQEAKAQKKFDSEVKKINNNTEYEIAGSKEKFSKLTELTLQSENISDETTISLMNKALNSIKKPPFMLDRQNLQEIEELEQLKIRQLKKENTPQTEIIKNLTDDLGILQYKANSTVAKTHNYAYKDSPLASTYANSISNKLAYNFESQYNEPLANYNQDRRICEDVTNRTEFLVNQGIKDMANNLAAKLTEDSLSPKEKANQQAKIAEQLLSKPIEDTIASMVVDGLEPRNK